MSTSQVVASCSAAIRIAAALGAAIKEMGPAGVPNGELYVAMMPVLSYDDYMGAIELLKKEQLVSEKHHLLTWIGSKLVWLDRWAYAGDNKVEQESYKIEKGKMYVVENGAPGTGRVVYGIVGRDENRTLAEVLEDTRRCDEPEAECPKGWDHL